MRFLRSAFKAMGVILLIWVTLSIVVEVFMPEREFLISVGVGLTMVGWLVWGSWLIFRRNGSTMTLEGSVVLIDEPLAGKVPVDGIKKIEIGLDMGFYVSTAIHFETDRRQPRRVFINTIKEDQVKHAEIFSYLANESGIHLPRTWKSRCEKRIGQAVK